MRGPANCEAANLVRGGRLEVAQRSEPSSATIPRLTLTERLAIQDYAARAAWPSGFQIYERGASADGVFIVVRGRVVLRSRVRAGRGFVPWVATPGETFGAEGLSPNGTYATEARADAETETLFLSASKLRAFIREQPARALAVVGQVMAERTALLEKLRELTTLSVEQRLVAALRRMAAHDSFTSGDGRIELCGARYRLLCELVGATRESVSLVLGRLSGEGLVERSGSTLYVTPSTRLFERLDDTSATDDALLVGTMADAVAAPVLV
jgi:CRP/FNR family cyclic AMP-dependent transcriptional regulator